VFARVLLLVVFFIFYLYLTNLASWLHDFNKLIYLFIYLLTYLLIRRYSPLLRFGQICQISAAFDTTDYKIVFPRLNLEFLIDTTLY